MARAPFQVLVLPFQRSPKGIRYAVFKRSDGGYWQGIAGGGEDEETPQQTAQREALEEAGIPADAPLFVLDTIASVPVIHFTGHEAWGADTYVIIEHCFGIEVVTDLLHLSDEHSEYQWLDFTGAHALLRYDSNRTALWELNRRLT